MEKSKWVPVVRWAARIWSLLPIMFGLAHLVSDEAETGIEVVWSEWLALGLAGLCLLGLALAWRWERFGAWLSIVALGIFVVVFVITVERIFPALLIIVLALGIPAVMFLAVSGRRPKAV